ncbi:Bax inhibitor-1/YccA family membrane protein [Streptomyces sp. NBC_01483]|uniref:Bax inhibitor-1/YccA family membrane protein n=1 Tax=Streptomyces sp. NBC_01483 TaxID=2903883 RepID=UPI002E301D0F|nr:Bax inhibitor-1/YccA family protein [Streptomyces sp. NBC_01483]
MPLRLGCSCCWWRTCCCHRSSAPKAWALAAWPAAFGVTLTLVWLYVETMQLVMLVLAEDI